MSLGVLAIVLAFVVGAFVANGIDDGWRSPDMGTITGTPVAETDGDELVVVAWNLAKLGFHRGGLEFAAPEEIERRLDAVAAVLGEEGADLVFRSSGSRRARSSAGPSTARPPGPLPLPDVGSTTSSPHGIGSSSRNECRPPSSRITAR